MASDANRTYDATWAHLIAAYIELRDLGPDVYPLEGVLQEASQADAVAPTPHGDVLVRRVERIDVNTHETSLVDEYRRPHPIGLFTVERPYTFNDEALELARAASPLVETGDARGRLVQSGLGHVWWD